MKTIQTILLSLIFVGLGLGQYPLDIINNNVVGAGGIWVGKTTLDQARIQFGEHENVALNFIYDQPFGESGKLYFAAIKVSGISMYWSIVVSEGRVTKLFIKTLIDANNPQDNEEILTGLYSLTVKDRVARLGYPQNEFGGLKGWSYNNTSYDLMLARNNSGSLQMTEAIYLNPE